MERIVDAKEYERQLDQLVDVWNLPYDDAFQQLGKPPEGFYREPSKDREEVYPRGLTLARAILAMRPKPTQNT